LILSADKKNGHFHQETEKRACAEYNY